MTWGWSLKAATNNNQIAFFNLRVPFLLFGKSPENALLAGRQLPALLDEGLFPCGQGALWHAKHMCMITLAWHNSHLL